MVFSCEPYHYSKLWIGQNIGVVHYKYLEWYIKNFNKEQQSATNGLSYCMVFVSGYDRLSTNCEQIC